MREGMGEKEDEFVFYVESYGQLKVKEIMTTAPKTIDEDLTAAEALGIMELFGITHLVILDRENKLKGVVHLHDLLGREEFRINGGLSSTKRVDS